MGQEFQGDVLSINGYGVLVRLSIGVVGLAQANHLDRFKVGEKLNVRIQSCDVAKHRILLEVV